MTKAFPTPGPWHLGGSLISNGAETVALILRKPAWFGGKEYATRDTDPDAPEHGIVAEANGHLIAAAPDLLAACVEAEQALGENLTWLADELDLHVRQGDAETVAKLAQLTAAWRTVCFAIAKAQKKEVNA